jgi:hypothetical protein
MSQPNESALDVAAALTEALKYLGILDTALADSLGACPVCAGRIGHLPGCAVRRLLDLRDALAVGQVARG